MRKKFVEKLKALEEYAKKEKSWRFWLFVIIILVLPFGTLVSLGILKARYNEEIHKYKRHSKVFIKRKISKKFKR